MSQDKRYGRSNASLKIVNWCIVGNTPIANVFPFYKTNTIPDKKKKHDQAGLCILIYQIELV